MSQVISITSEALQSTIRALLPSQQGFGDDLQASNVIVPVVDLTPTAEGSQTPAVLQQAVSYTDATSFDIANTTSTIVSTTGFFRVLGTAYAVYDAAGTNNAIFQLSDGSGTKTIYGLNLSGGASTEKAQAVAFDFVVFLPAGHSLSGSASDNGCRLLGNVRQIATVNGTLTTPTDFQPQ